MQSGITPAGSLVGCRYRLIRLLGEGGLGRVHLASDLSHEGRLVALKQIQPAYLSREAVASLQAEFKAMTNLHHPNVVEVFALEMEESAGGPFLTIEYVEGTDLKTAAALMDFHGKLELLVQACRGLDYIHARGLIHNDLKPQNILVTSSHPVTCKLTDFGLVTSAHENENRAGVRGTFHYLAPEVLAGEKPDPRSDLYALGIVAYLILTGRHPFTGDPGEILAAVLSGKPPEAPSAINPEIPAALDALILRLISADPGRRPDSAGSVITAIAAATGIPFVVDTPVTLPSRLASSVMVGRDTEKQRLTLLLDAILPTPASSGPTRLVLLSGESGVGKSRLLRQIQCEAQSRGIAAAVGPCYEGSAAAYHPFLPILRELLPHALSDEALAAILNPVQQRDDPGITEASAPGSPEPLLAEQRQRLALEAAVRGLRALSGERAVLIVIEDLQWADATSINLLEHLARNTPADGRIAVIASYRSEEAESPHLAAALARLHRSNEWDRMELGRLQVNEIHAMLAAMLGTDAVPGDLVGRILEETEGNPLFVQLAVEALFEEKAIGRRGAAWVADLSSVGRLAIPASIAEAIRRRLQPLSPVAREVMDALAVLERPAEFPLISALLRGDTPDAAWTPALHGLLDDLVLRRLAAREATAGGSILYRIDHLRIREQVYEEMDWERRRLLHGRAGEAIEKQGTAGVEELAHHFVNSENLDRALDYAERAGRHALEIYASDRAVAFLDRAVELVPPSDPERRLRLQLALGDACRQTSDLTRALEIFERVARGARACGARGLAHAAAGRMIRVQSRTGQIEEAQRSAERLVSVLRAEGEKASLAACLTALSQAAVARGDTAKARAFNEESLALRREAGDLDGAASNLNNLALLAIVEGGDERIPEWLGESLAIRRQMGDEKRAAEALNNLANWQQSRGDLDAAAASAEEACTIARGHRDPWASVPLHATLCGIYRSQGRADVALEAARRAAADARAVGATQGQGEALDQIGMIYRDLGQTAQALEVHGEALTLARKAALPAQEAFALASQALDHLVCSEPGETAVKTAREMIKKAVRLAGGSDRLHLRLAQAQTRLHRFAGETDQALSSARAAIQRAEAAGLPDEQAAAALLTGEILLGLGGPEPLEEAAAMVKKTTESAVTMGLATVRWEGHALLSRIEGARGRRATERDALAQANSAIEEVASLIKDETIRLAWLSEPKRAAIVRKAAALPKVKATAHTDASAEKTLAAFYEVTSVINSMSDLDALLERILDVALGIVGAERGLITLQEETDPSRQCVRAARDLETETLEDVTAYSHSVVHEAAQGKSILSLDAPTDERFRTFRSVSLYAIKSLMCVPMRVRDVVIGTVYVDSRRHGIPFSDQDLRFLEAFASLAASAVEQSRLHARLAAENVYLRKEAGVRNQYQNLIGRSTRMQAVYDLMDKIGASTLPVLIQGESGTGKELVARGLHYNGPRRNGRFCSENVAAIPDTLMESEMFGHVRGAFTGADRDRKGLFEMADGGTLFLDEIGDMSLPMQSKLLRAIQEGEIRPVGAKEPRKVDVRILSATNKDLELMMREGRFREDLYYRLNVVRIPLPPLRERKEDIPLLVDHFLQRIAKEAGGAPRKIEMGAMQLLLRYGWPGNIRELENEIQRLAVLAEGAVISLRDVISSGELYEKITRLEAQESFAPLEEMERRQIEKALTEAAGNRGRAAELLGISRATIFRKLRKFGISH